MQRLQVLRRAQDDGMRSFDALRAVRGSILQSLLLGRAYHGGVFCEGETVVSQLAKASNFDLPKSERNGLQNIAWCLKVTLKYDAGAEREVRGSR